MVRAGAFAYEVITASLLLMSSSFDGCLHHLQRRPDVRGSMPIGNLGSRDRTTHAGPVDTRDKHPGGALDGNLPDRYGRNGASRVSIGWCRVARTARVMSSARISTSP